MAQLVGRAILGLDSGHDPRVVGSSPVTGSVLSTVSACPLPSLYSLSHK